MLECHSWALIRVCLCNTVGIQMSSRRYHHHHHHLVILFVLSGTVWGKEKSDFGDGMPPLPLFVYTIYEIHEKRWFQNAIVADLSRRHLNFSPQNARIFKWRSVNTIFAKKQPAGSSRSRKRFPEYTSRNTYTALRRDTGLNKHLPALSAPRSTAAAGRPCH